jgi:hypothetical protein
VGEKGLFWQLAESLKEPEALDPTKIPELVEKQVENALKTRQEGEAKRRQAEFNASWEAGSQAFAEEAKAELKTNPDKYPLVRKRGVSVGWDAEKGEPKGEVDKFIMAHYRATKDVPTSAQILEHFEGLYRKEAEELAGAIGFVKPAPAPAPPATPVSNDWARDGRGAATAPAAETTKRQGLREKTEAMLERAAEIDRRRRASAG